MATARGSQYGRRELGRAGALIVGCTLLLTATFVGLVALVTGQAAGLGVRLPVYVLAMATAFVGSILILEAEYRDGRTIIATAGLLALGTFVVATLAAEGVVHAIEHPAQLVASQMLFYFLAAGLIGTGISFWVANHWQELGVDVGGNSGLGR